MDLLRRDEVHVGVDGAGGQHEALAGDGLGRHADDEVVAHPGHDVRVAGLPDARDAAVLDADVRLADAGPVDDEGVRDHAVEGALVGDAGRLPHAVAQHLSAAELALVAVDGRVVLHLRHEAGVAQPHAVAARRSVEIRVVPSVDAVRHDYSQLPRSRPASTGPLAHAFPPRTIRLAGDRHQPHRPALARLEADRRARRDVETVAVGGPAVEHQGAVGLEEVVVAADLDRPVAGVRDRQLDGGAALVERDLPGGCQDLARGARHRRRRSARGRRRCLRLEKAAVERQRAIPVLRDDRMVHGHELGAVGERALHLHFVDHVGNTVEHLGRPQEAAPEVHQLGHRPAVPDEL